MYAIVLIVCIMGAMVGFLLLLKKIFPVPSEYIQAAHSFTESERAYKK